ncbi:DUF2235 domain-containing protein [Gordonia insulae]|uniref:T6SS Phospholipase effector Tle1-like catalytic domain-containing protein n=1 Tax=Gordonia insulae TaxID=2420509 RepID=A0A3G8JHX2_9ACTN|nr:DUF2235 domain-containing protein [Gordonia insulae]AZG44508.1 hypothetical protein D7316_01094 [Gordonia insulae]
MKRLIICCDGTWKTAQDPHISNIEKIARAIRTRAGDGTMQLVHYCNGVGTGATWFDRVIGGAFGRGLDLTLIDAYRFLALNYEPGDEIFVFGFSRGAYTARSLTDMVGTVGLLTADALACSRGRVNLLDAALTTYRDYRRTNASNPGSAARDALSEFRRHTYGSARADTRPRIKFIGVFDTVGALGVPGVTRQNYGFLNVELSDSVDVARQALAIDERRLTFDPCVWTTDGEGPTDVRQVWFEGVHSDIGGGLERGEPSTLSLTWMVSEASQHGLEIERARMPEVLTARPDVLGEEYLPNNSMSWAYQVVNLMKLIVDPFRVDSRVAKRHKRQVRVLEVTDDAASPMFIAEPAYRRWAELSERNKRAKNISWWVDQLGPEELEKRVVKIPTL